MLQACTNPEMAAEITLQPVRRHDVDAAVFFSDIVVPLFLAGVGIDIVAGVGPVLDNPVRKVEDVERLTQLEVADWSPIEQAATLVRQELPFEKVLLGFAGAPFTLASYLIESSEPGASKAERRACKRTKEFIRKEPKAWRRLATWCAKLSGQFMAAQIRGGAEAVQLFDSWAGTLSLEEYRLEALPFSALAFEVARGAKHIHFAVDSGHLLEALGELSQVVSVGIDVSLDEAARRLPGKVLQGNLDPSVLVGDEPEVCLETAWEQAKQILALGRAAPAHIFNLGHGVLPNTDPGVLTELVARIHAW